MKNVIYFLLMSFLTGLISCKNQPPVPVIQEEDLIGYWRPSSGDVEYYCFEKYDSSFIYSGYLHQRVMTSGTYKIEGNKFIMVADNGYKSEYEFTFKNDTLNLDNGKEILSKFNSEELESKTDDLLLLELMANDLGFSSTTPVKEDFKWAFQPGDSSGIIQRTIHGYKITKEVIIKNDFSDLNPALGEISRYLEDHLYWRDSLNVTEICNGFQSTFTVALICTRCNPEPVKNEPAYIDLYCGQFDAGAKDSTDQR